jgi:threonine/homoserine/homoserine lactone efflux protein
MQMEMFPVSTAVGRIAVLVVAIAVLVGFLLWSRRARSNSFFLGVLSGAGLVLSFDIVWIHWLFGLHHVTNTREDLVLEPLLVLTGLVFLWFGLRREQSAR